MKSQGENGENINNFILGLSTLWKLSSSGGFRYRKERSRKVSLYVDRM